MGKLRHQKKPYKIAKVAQEVCGRAEIQTEAGWGQSLPTELVSSAARASAMPRALQVLRERSDPGHNYVTAGSAQIREAPLFRGLEWDEEALGCVTGMILQKGIVTVPLHLHQKGVQVCPDALSMFFLWSLMGVSLPLAQGFSSLARLTSWVRQSFAWKGFLCIGEWHPWPLPTRC